ncbi:MAG: hypothetical protein ACMG6S_25200, partial [Byssovorax sp.]
MSVPEKAIAHGAVTVIRGPKSGETAAGQQASLQLGWAVFLPLAARFEAVIVEGATNDWRIFLHGYSFPDSGRQIVQGLDDAGPGAAVSDAPSAETEVRGRWNRLVRDLETMRCLLPAVKRASELVPLVEGEALGRALARSRIFEKNRAAAGAEWSLVWGPSLSGPAAKWLRRSSRLLPLPRPRGEESEAVIGLVARLLRIEGDGAAIVWEDSPGLCERTSWDSWAQADVRAALAEGLESELKDASALRYFARCLESIRATYPSVGRHLPEVLRRVLQKKLPLSSEPTRLAWRDVIAFCSPADILWSGSSLALVREIAAMSPPPALVVLPTDLRPSNWAPTLLPAIVSADAISLLRFVAAKIADDRDDAAQKLASEVVAAFGAANVLQEPTISRLQVFRVWSALHGNICLTAQALSALRDHHRAYRSGGAFGHQQVARVLRNVLADPALDVVLAFDNLAIAFGLVDLSQSTIALLFGSNCPQLGREAERIAVIALFTSGVPHFTAMAPSHAAANPPLRRALRTLLHGEPGRAGDETSLLYAVTTGFELSTQLLQQLFHVTSSEWRLLPAGMIRDLDWMQALGIIQLTGRSLVRFLGNVPGSWRDEIGALLSGEQRASLRELIFAEKDEELFRALRIHDAAEKVVSAEDADVFLAAERKVPVALAAYVNLVVPDVTSSFQERCFRRWSLTWQLRLCILLPEADRFAPEILDAIADWSGERSAQGEDGGRDLRHEVRKSPWVPVSGHGPVRPLDI